MKSKKLYRSNKNKIIAGVFGGLGDYFNIDPTLLRLIGIVLAFLTGIIPIVILYLLAAIIIPEEPPK